MSPVYIGVAGWSIPPFLKAKFAGEGSHLKRYARVMKCVEINSSFHREHNPQTYRRWAASVPGDFRFSVKLSKYFTREMKLKQTGSQLEYVIEAIAPVIYRSRYEDAVMSRLADRIRGPLSTTDETWCIFDNTTLGHGTENALMLKRRL